MKHTDRPRGMIRESVHQSAPEQAETTISPLLKPQGDTVNVSSSPKTVRPLYGWKPFKCHGGTKGISEAYWFDYELERNSMRPRNIPFEVEHVHDLVVGSKLQLLSRDFFREQLYWIGTDDVPNHFRSNELLRCSSISRNFKHPNPASAHWCQSHSSRQMLGQVID